MRRKPFSSSDSSAFVAVSASVAAATAAATVAVAAAAAVGVAAAAADGNAYSTVRASGLTWLGAYRLMPCRSMESLRKAFFEAPPCGADRQYI